MAHGLGDSGSSSIDSNRNSSGQVQYVEKKLKLSEEKNDAMK